MAIARTDYSTGAIKNPFEGVSNALLGYSDRLAREKQQAMQSAREAQKMKLLQDQFKLTQDRNAQEQAEKARLLDAERATNAGLLAINTPDVAAQEYVSPETGQKLLEQYNKTGKLGMDEYTKAIQSPEAVRSTKQFLLSDPKADQLTLLNAEKTRYENALRTPGTPEYKAAQKAAIDAENRKFEQLKALQRMKGGKSKDTSGLIADVLSKVRTDAGWLNINNERVDAQNAVKSIQGLFPDKIVANAVKVATDEDGEFDKGLFDDYILSNRSKMLQTNR